MKTQNQGDGKKYKSNYDKGFNDLFAVLKNVVSLCECGSWQEDKKMKRHSGKQ